MHLFDWDEINFAECAREMLISGNYARVQIEFLPFWEKPPLFLWFQALSMRIFGVNEYAARFPNALAGIITLPLLFWVGKQYYDRSMGIFWVLAYAGSFLPHFYFKSGIIDPWFNLFIFLSVLQLVRLTESEDRYKRNLSAWLGGMFLGLAVLTKGPVAVFLVGLCGLGYWLMSRRWLTFRIMELLRYIVALLAISAIWFLPETLQNGFWFVKEFFEYQVGLALRGQDTGHEQPFWYHFVVLLVGCFPASIYFLANFLERKSPETPIQNNLHRWLALLFWVTLVVFSLVSTKIIHYSSLCYFSLTFFAAHYLWRLQPKKSVEGNETPEQTLALPLGGRILKVCLGLIWAIALLVLPFVGKYKDRITPYIQDDFAVANLQANVHWSGWEVLIGVVFLLSFLYAILPIEKNTSKRAFVLFGGVAITLQLIMYIFIPKIERYTQGAHIDFLKEVKKENAYLSTIDFHSYAYHYYGEITPKRAKEKRAFLENHFGGKDKLQKISPSLQKDAWNMHLLKDSLSRPAYLVGKIGSKAMLDKEPLLEKVSEKNGFVFYKRK